MLAFMFIKVSKFIMEAIIFTQLTIIFMVILKIIIIIIFIAKVFIQFFSTVIRVSTFKVILLLIHLLSHLPIQYFHYLRLQLRYTH